MLPELKKILQHYNSFFKGHEFSIHSWPVGPISKVVENFCVVCFKPGKTIDLWVYCSIGASTIFHDNGGRFEFAIISPREDERNVEMLAMMAYYHSNQQLGFGHTVPIGEPWLDDSLCDHWLVSLPYPFGNEFEILPLGDSHAHVAWLLPITKAERDFKAENGLEALEQKFEDEGLEYWVINRNSIV